MSKAFVNEDTAPEEDLDLDLDGEDELESAVSKSGGRNYITTLGLSILKAEFHELLHNERPKVVEVVAWAASNGDRSENADYQYGKKRLREIDRRIRFLTKRIDAAVAVEPTEQKGEKILFGATVRVRDSGDADRTYRIVGIDETDAKSGKVSWISPVGQALLQASEGDSVVLKTPLGEEELEVLEVKYLPIV